MSDRRFSRSSAPGSPLLLVPSPLELDVVKREFDATSSRVELCGFGPIAAASRTSQLVEQHSPDSVLLLGIAGSLSSGLTVGEAYEFGQVACYGIGAGTGHNFQTAGEMGWQQWADEPLIGDMLPLSNAVSQRLLLSSCSASGDASDVATRLAKYPTAEAEDMEGFAVAAACRLAGVPCRVIRGISNKAGDRDHRKWQVTRAMTSAIELASCEK